MRPFLFIGRIGILTSLALICWLPALSTQAADHVPGTGHSRIHGSAARLWPQRTDHSGCSGARATGRTTS